LISAINDLLAGAGKLELGREFAQELQVDCLPLNYVNVGHFVYDIFGVESGCPDCSEDKFKLPGRSVTFGIFFSPFEPASFLATWNQET
jgi:hypothetical protein